MNAGVERSPASNSSRPSKATWVLVFVAMFVCYQAPEGVGLRLLNNVTVMLVLMLTFFPVAWICGRLCGYRRFDAWFMAISPGWFKLLAVAFLAAIVAKALALTIGALTGVYRIVPAATSPGWGVLLALLTSLAMTFFPSVAEDIVTRGYWLRVLSGRVGTVAFVLISAALYVLNHVYRLSHGPFEWFMLFCYGLAYAAALALSRSLWPAIGLHWGWNFAGSFSDSLVAVDLLIPWAGKMLSGMTHLCLLAMVVLLFKSDAEAKAGP